ncbi:hypothetical protein T4B_8641 [Trichinella pseudospiralis]|uniref:Uncharacterized protein n=2 Tax=Trichinella pseudospiralis TaxID=6337 RepID=A0A0V1IBI3_TRIPS|nr:hypothetical protein T4E_3681 [Trichinella pseudospiralis]KRY92082.1 hypothetical protein T4D_3358 [Trichinella pseudospiralis]KRZ20204.1 hypothetical protein T4B_8641 [Trichinella pseudospiralis]
MRPQKQNAGRSWKYDLKVTRAPKAIPLIDYVKMLSPYYALHTIPPPIFRLDQSDDTVVSYSSNLNLDLDSSSRPIKVTSSFRKRNPNNFGFYLLPNTGSIV